MNLSPSQTTTDILSFEDLQAVILASARLGLLCEGMKWQVRFKSPVEKNLNPQGWSLCAWLGFEEPLSALLYMENLDVWISPDRAQMQAANEVGVYLPELICEAEVFVDFPF